MSFIIYIKPSILACSGERGWAHWPREMLQGCCTHVKGLGLNCIYFQEPASNWTSCVWPSQRKQWEKGKWKAVEKKNQNNVTRWPKRRTVGFAMAVLQFSHLGLEQEQWEQPIIKLSWYTQEGHFFPWAEWSIHQAFLIWEIPSYFSYEFCNGSQFELIIISKARSAGRVSDTILLIGFIYPFFSFQCLL